MRSLGFICLCLVAITFTDASDPRHGACASLAEKCYDDLHSYKTFRACETFVRCEYLDYGRASSAQQHCVQRWVNEADQCDRQYPPSFWHLIQRSICGRRIFDGLQDCKARHGK
ncbi:uncharacterized protein [Clytia hemisphaerica]|uniref:uncharacterized protein n=1 Tax=Clytia hemisphaerica TaxID=252671 RepID=UPI0034D4B708